MAKVLKRIKLATKYPKVLAQPVEKTVSYPSFYVRDKKLPLDGEDVGKIFNATVKLKLTGISERTEANGNDSLNYDLEVREIVFNKQSM